MNTKNLNYAFHVEYYKDSRFKDDKTFPQKNRELLSIAIPKFNFYKTECGFTLQTRYPGLLIGVGNPHGSGGKSDIALGFTFDYVTGTPYIPGSSIKGVLRSTFSKEEYIKCVLGNDDLDVSKLEKEIFEGIRDNKETAVSLRDTFYDAFPETTGRIMAMEAITPHGGDETNEPNPLTLIKVKPNVKFYFSFKLFDGMISVNEKLALFKQIITDFGLGAKTNVGFGIFTD